MVEQRQREDGPGQVQRRCVRLLRRRVTAGTENEILKRGEARDQILGLDLPRTRFMPEPELGAYLYGSALSLAGDTSDGVRELRLNKEEIIGAIGMPRRRIDHTWIDQI